ncbi:hypothetical protein L2E82_32686 [Cichorium intybus]|uniref:Uncharacterized protein n=1 Tax=Cichorium intybus TaxID=13427 RepID=A0ACB9BH42_CICIN|nr:hypothetical protein L2E82_32686 [Cichorium intybus]
MTAFSPSTITHPIWGNRHLHNATDFLYTLLGLTMMGYEIYLFAKETIGSGVGGFLSAFYGLNLGIDAHCSKASERTYVVAFLDWCKFTTDLKAFNFVNTDSEVYCAENLKWNRKISIIRI